MKVSSVLTVAAIAAVAVQASAHFAENSHVFEFKDSMIDADFAETHADEADYSNLLTEADFQEHAEDSYNYFLERTYEAEETGLTANAQVLGLDYSQGFNLGVHQCFKREGNSFVIPRGYQSLGRIDPNLASNVRNARAAGIKYVDVYHFPCPTCSSSGAAQFLALKNYIAANKLNVGMIWLDIEGTQYWRGAAHNRNFLISMINAAKKTNTKIGIYANAYQWNSIMGSGFTVARGYPLWYPHYDGKRSMANFTKFGGWNKANIKQYVGDTVRCGAGVDLNYY